MMIESSASQSPGGSGCNRHRFQKCGAIIENLNATAAGHEHVSRDVLHALTAETPKTRYQTGPDWEQWAPMLSLSDEERDGAFLEMLQ